MEIIIKNMVCPRCNEAVCQILSDLDIDYLKVELGKVELKEELSVSRKETLMKSLAKKGFELLDDKQAQLVNKIKTIIIEEVHHSKNQKLVNFSSLLVDQLYYEYTYLSRLFSAVAGQTIEKFVLAQKIEKVKEYLTYNQITIAEIAQELHYSSAAHLSSQFKRMTGMSPSAFRELQIQERKFIDKI